MCTGSSQAQRVGGAIFTRLGLPTLVDREAAVHAGAGLPPGSVRPGTASTKVFPQTTYRPLLGGKN